jgi:hypothetical protein
LLRRSIDIQHRVFRVWREKQRKTVGSNLDVRVAVRVRARDVDAWEIDSCIRHVFTVAEEASDARPRGDARAGAVSRARWITATPSLVKSSVKMLFGKPATADKSEIGSLGARVRPSDRFRDHREHRR